MRTVKVNGKVLTVLQSKPSRYENTEVILVSGWNDYTPFVVWRLYQDGSCHHGSYCLTLGDALSKYENRD